MVRILSNGDIDDGPPPPQQRRPGQPQQPVMNDAPRIPNGPSELFNYANDRLLTFGLPRVPIGGYVVEPVHLVIALLSLVLFGPMALIVVAAVIYISQQDGEQTVPPPSNNSQSSSQSSPRQIPSASTSKKPFGGSGQRLGA